MKQFLMAVMVSVELAAVAKEKTVALGETLPGQTEATVTEGATAKIAYYVTDFAHSKVRFGDDSKRFDVGLTGRYRNCTFENCQLVGPKDRFTDCKIGAGCSTAEK